MLHLKKKNILIIGSVFGAITLALYPIIIAPARKRDYYEKIQERALKERKNLGLDKIENPQNLGKWQDPFDRPKKSQVQIERTQRRAQLLENEK